MPKVRLEFVADFGPRRGQVFAGAVLEPNHETIIKYAANKLKLKTKTELFLVLRDRYVGTRLLEPDVDLSKILRDGCTIVLTTSPPREDLPKPPHWPFEDARGSARVSTAEEVKPSCALAPLPPSGERVLGDWHGCWPVLEGNVLPLLREAVGKVSGFVEKDMGDYLSFDYHASTASAMQAMFPNPDVMPRKSRERLLAAVRRECRGLLVHSSTGMVLARRLPKFFNVDEVEETKMDALPSSVGVATQKLDGSLVSPVLVGGTLRWAGKAALLPSVETFVSESVSNIATDLVSKGETPLFEWCEAGPPVGVMGHQHHSLTLLAVRHNVTGEFWSDQKLRSLGCDVVERVVFDDLPALLQRTRSLSSMEGVVVAWPDLGRLVKLKTVWWVSLSASLRRSSGQPALALAEALLSLPLSKIPLSSVWQGVLTGDDDQMSLIYSRLRTSEQSSLRAFGAACERGVMALDCELQEWAASVGDVDISQVAGGWPVALLSSYQCRAPISLHELRKCLAKQAAAEQVAGLESLLGASWAYEPQPLEVLAHLGTFEQATNALSAHVLEHYLPRKLEEYTGAEVVEETTIMVPRLHDPVEGKIKGMWEVFSKDGIMDLRVDLQPRAKVYDFHNGDCDFAHWQVQFGPDASCPRSSKFREGDRRGAFAAVLLRTEVNVEYRLLRKAFQLSFETRHVVKLDPSPTRMCHVFLDLDGVLVDFDAGFDKDVHASDAKARWQFIERTPGFFESLPWIEGAQCLWDHVRQVAPVTILTGVPEGPLGERSAAEKKRWVSRELGEVEIITCLSREKPRFGGQGRLLIDDRPQRGWEVAGGRQIVHRSASESLSALVELGLGRPFTAVMSNIALINHLTEELRGTCASASAVAVDVEWKPDRAGVASPVALIQLAFQPSDGAEVFVVDALGWNAELQDFLRTMFRSELPKLVFGDADEGRLQMRMNAVENLQEGSESLSTQARRAGLVINKSKRLQASDWSMRPLREEQIVYAATDALVLHQLRKHGRPGTRASHSSGGGRGATVQYVGAFLTDGARKKLLRHFPPVFPEVCADHLTLDWMPSSIRGLTIGLHQKLQVVSYAAEHGVQAVGVATVEVEPRVGHVTISHKSDVLARDAGDLSYEPIDGFTVDAVVGACLTLGVERDTLPDAVLVQVHELLEAEPGKSLRFDGLTDSQRHSLHLVAAEHNLEHRSEGKKGTRHRRLIVTKPKRWRNVEERNTETIIVKDPRKFAAFFGDVPGLQVHGRVMATGIRWQPGVVVPLGLQRVLAGTNQGDLFAVILRGFPGSGKSSMAALLRSHAEVISADDHRSDVEDVAEAHEICRNLFLDVVRSKRCVVVDNTNIRKSDYAFYRTTAEASGYSVVILEMICDSTDELELFRKRSVHSVPGSVVGAMWSRWEEDAQGLRLAPYVPQQLIPWLKEKGMLDGPPRTCTHLVMPKGPHVRVPANSRAEFLERFAAEWGQNHISEIGRPDRFQLFFDIDNLSLAELLPRLSELRALVGVPLVLTGFAGPPGGYHIFAPRKFVDAAAAHDLRRQWLTLVPDLEAHVDGNLYDHPQLRLVGSRKISKEGVDTGRVHDVLGRFDKHWEPGVPWSWSDVSLHG